MNYHLELIETGATCIPAENSSNLGVSNHPEVIATVATYILSEKSSNLLMSNHLEVIGTGVAATFQQRTNLTWM